MSNNLGLKHNHFRAGMKDFIFGTQWKTDMKQKTFNLKCVTLVQKRLYFSKVISGFTPEF